MREKECLKHWREMSKFMVEINLTNPFVIQVSIVPVIAKSDCLTMSEIKKLKKRILEEIRENGRSDWIFNLLPLSKVSRYTAFLMLTATKMRNTSYRWITETTEDWDTLDFVCKTKFQVAQLRESIPFAVCGANAMVEVAGKKVRGRQYPWGIVDVENPEHCDFIKLRSMLITHMQDLQEVWPSQ